MTHARLLPVACLAILSASAANADILNFNWSTTGFFTDTSFVTFSGVTAQTAATDREGNIPKLKLGVFTFRDTAIDFSGLFRLNVTFLMPGGAENASYSVPYLVRSNINGNGNSSKDSLFVGFSTATLLTVDSPQWTGSFLLDIPAVNVTRSGNDQTRSFDLIGSVSDAHLASVPNDPVTTIPESPTFVLFGTGAGGLAVAKRRKTVTPTE